MHRIQFPMGLRLRPPLGELTVLPKTPWPYLREETVGEGSPTFQSYFDHYIIQDTAHVKLLSSFTNTVGLQVIYFATVVMLIVKNHDKLVQGEPKTHFYNCNNCVNQFSQFCHIFYTRHEISKWRILSRPM